MAEEMKKDEEGVTPSDPNPCPICLGFFTQESYLDRCFHRFCYQCIVRWTQVVSCRSSSSSRNPSSVKCPLCKTDNFSIIYGYDGNTFQQHFLNPNHSTSTSTFFTNGHKYRLQCYYTEPGVLSDTFNVGRYWKTRKYLQPNIWFEKWLRRELQALIQEEDVEIILHHILGVFQSFSTRRDPKHTPQQRQEEFRVLVCEAARPFLTERTDRFVYEVELFLSSGLMVEAYDGIYKRCLGWKKSEESSKEAEITATDHKPISPYLHLFDDDSEEVDWEEQEDGKV